MKANWARPSSKEVTRLLNLSKPKPKNKPINWKSPSPIRPKEKPLTRFQSPGGSAFVLFARPFPFAGELPPSRQSPLPLPNMSPHTASNHKQAYLGIQYTANPHVPATLSQLI